MPTLLAKNEAVYVLKSDVNLTPHQSLNDQAKSTSTSNAAKRTTKYQKSVILGVTAVSINRLTIYGLIFVSKETMQIAKNIPHKYFL